VVVVVRVVVLVGGLGRAEREAGDRGDEADHRHDPGEHEVPRVDVQAELTGHRQPQRRDEAGREEHQADRGGRVAARGAAAETDASEGGRGASVGRPVGALPVVWAPVVRRSH
jgi:hypothetical protein